jgi:hypothetical protein
MERPFAKQGSKHHTTPHFICFLLGFIFKTDGALRCIYCLLFGVGLFITEKIDKEVAFLKQITLDNVF